MRIAIIGGSGFVGSRLISLLQTIPDSKLLNIDKQPSKLCPDITEIADVLDVRKLTELLVGIEVVVLLAAEHRDDVTPTSLYYKVNVEGMHNTLHAMKSNGISRLIFTSSVAVYGLNKSNPTELHPTDPFNDYGHRRSVHCSGGILLIRIGILISCVLRSFLERIIEGMYITCSVR